jgi:hypothetical protein
MKQLSDGGDGLLDFMNIRGAALTPVSDQDSPFREWIER